MRRARGGARQPLPWLLVALVLLLAWCVVVVHAAAPVGCSAAAGSCVRIGYFACLTPANCTNAVGYNEMLAWYRQRTAAVPLMGVPTYWVEATQLGFFSETSDEINATIARVFIGPNPAVPLVDYVLLPFGSVWETGMYLLEQAKIPSIGALSPSASLYQCGATEAVWKAQLGCKAPNSRRYQYAHCLANPGEQYFQPWVGQLKLRKAKTIALVRTSMPFYSGVRAGIVTAASDNSMRVVYDKMVEDNSPGCAARVVRELVALAEGDQPDGLAIISNDCVPWIQAMKAAEYAPKSVAALLCTDNPTVIDQLGDDLYYIVGSSQWAVDLGGNDYSENEDTQPWALFPHIKNEQPLNDTSPLQFQQFFRQLMRQPTAVPSYAEAGVLIAPNILEAAMTLAGSVDPEKVNAQLNVFYQTSYYGLITTNRFGQNSQKQLVVNQRDRRGVLRLISPMPSATADLTYPMPPWEEREYTARMYATAIEQTLIALLIACCLTTLGLMAYIFVRRDRQIFQAAGLPFHLLMGFGCIAAYLGVLTWPVENNASTCHARLWLWTVPFHLAVDPVLASAYRIATITASQLQMRRIANKTLGVLVAALVTPQLILNCLWAGLSPLEPSVVTSDLLRPASTSFTTCSPGDHGLVFVVLTLGYCGLLLASAVFLAYRVRHTYAMFNDARPLAGSIYLFALVAAVVLVVQITLNEDSVSSQKVLFGLRSIGVLLAYQGSIGMLFLRGIIDSCQALPARSAGVSSHHRTSTHNHHRGIGLRSSMKTRQGDHTTPRVRAHPSPLKAAVEEEWVQSQSASATAAGAHHQASTARRHLSFDPNLPLSPVDDFHVDGDDVSEDDDGYDDRSHAHTSRGDRAGEDDAEPELSVVQEEEDPHHRASTSELPSPLSSQEDKASMEQRTSEGGPSAASDTATNTTTSGGSGGSARAIPSEFDKQESAGHPRRPRYPAHPPSPQQTFEGRQPAGPISSSPGGAPTRTSGGGGGRAPFPPTSELRSLSTDEFIMYLTAFHALIQEQQRELQANQAELQRQANLLREATAIAAATAVTQADDQPPPPLEKDLEKHLE